MHRTQSETDGWTDSTITICLPKFLWGHKKNIPGNLLTILHQLTKFEVPTYTDFAISRLQVMNGQ